MTQLLSSAAAGLFAGLGALTFLVILLIIVVAVFEVWMFVHAILNQALPTERKLLWLVGMILVHPFVAIAYYFTDYKKA